MRLTPQEFQDLPHKTVTLLGMSGVGKTRLASQLDQKQWFHYSGDYRIGTRYLDESILDDLKERMMTIPFLARLLRSDSIYIRNNITIDNLEPVLAFLGKPGNPDLGGLSLEDFKERLRIHHDAEVQAMRDIPDFIRKGQQIYGYPHFLNDAGGSLCELQDPKIFELLAEHSLILYIHAGDQHIQELTERQKQNPKPLYYPEPFLDRELDVYRAESGIEDYQAIEPDEFTRWAFPRLLQDRLERYQRIARDFGYTVSMDETHEVRNADDFVALIVRALEREN